MHPKAAAAAGREDLAALGTALGTALEIAGAHSHTVDARVAMAADADPVDTGIVGTDYCEVLAGPLPAGAGFDDKIAVAAIVDVAAAGN